MYCIREIQRISGVRVGEVLNVKAVDIMDNQNIYIHGSKGSNDRIVNCPAVISIICKNVDINTRQSIFTVSYTQYYRFLKKHGDILHIVGKKNNYVSHSFRKKLLNQIYNSGCAKKEKIGHAIGHRSKKTINYYIKE